MLVAILSAALMNAPPAAGVPDAAPPNPPVTAAPEAPIAPPATAPTSNPATPALATARPAHGSGANPSRDARTAARATAESELMATLVPAPSTAEEMRATAAALGAEPGAKDSLDSLLLQYESLTKVSYANASALVHSRLSAAYRSATATGSLEPMAGPELAALLEATIDWRRTLAAADMEFITRAATLRTSEPAQLPGMALFMRVVKRDDVPANDPAAAVRLPDLLDESGITGIDRRRIEGALERHWSRLASVIAARRVELMNTALDRARLEESWGPAWELTAPQATIDERIRLLDQFAARDRASEAPLRAANHDAALALLKMLPAPAAELLRDAADRSIWPWIFDSESALELSVTRATEIGGPSLGEPLTAMMYDLQLRLNASRRELSKRAANSEEIDAIVASAQSGAPPQTVVALLSAQRRLQELIDKRRRLVRDTAVRMEQASSGDPRTRAIFAERIMACDAETRTAQWRLRGIDDRIAQLNAGDSASDQSTDMDESTTSGGSVKDR